MERKTKRIFISEFMAKINKNEFNKSDFDKLSKDENVNIQKINLDSRNDNKILKKDVINQVYSLIFYLNHSATSLEKYEKTISAPALFIQ